MFFQLQIGQGRKAMEEQIKNDIDPIDPGCHDKIIENDYDGQLPRTVWGKLKLAFWVLLIVICIHYISLYPFF